MEGYWAFDARGCVISDLTSFILPQDGAFGQFRKALGMLLASKEIFRPESIPARLVREMMSRLRQLDYLQAKTMEAEDIVGNLVTHTQWRSDVARTFEQTMFKSQLHAEAFYLFAFRIIDITRNINDELFGKTKICPEPKGVRDVRNQLIVHPTKGRQQPVLNRSFHVSMEDGRGVVLKSLRLPGEGADPVDAGFRSNTAEFQSFVHDWTAEVGNRLGVFSKG